MSSNHATSLVIIVVGASGDLAKRKIYPSLLALYAQNPLPRDEVVIWGYARSKKTHSELRQQLKPALASSYDAAVVDAFLDKCFYHQGTSYGDSESWRRLHATMEAHNHNRLYYFAIPPKCFGETGQAIQPYCLSSSRNKGWSRIIVEKPFGRDYESCRHLLSQLDHLFLEEQLFRIDHYLGKMMVKSIPQLRYSLFKSMWNANHIDSILIQFKEDFGTQGRGGYFDDYGIIRDVMQNHLLQNELFLCMPSSDNVSDAKCKTLRAMTVDLDNVLVGQYDGYADDETIVNKRTKSPTYALLRLFCNLPQWQDVPIVMEAGKALDERTCRAVITFRGGSQQELVLTVQPQPSISLKLAQSSDPPISMQHNYPKQPLDAYATLLLEAIHGRHQESFVGREELLESWKLFDELMKRDMVPMKYRPGSTGPTRRQDVMRKLLTQQHAVLKASL